MEDLRPILKSEHEGHKLAAIVALRSRILRSDIKDADCDSDVIELIKKGLFSQISFLRFETLNTLVVLPKLKKSLSDELNQMRKSETNKRVQEMLDGYFF